MYVREERGLKEFSYPLPPLLKCISSQESSANTNTACKAAAERAGPRYKINEGEGERRPREASRRVSGRLGRSF